MCNIILLLFQSIFMIINIIQFAYICSTMIKCVTINAMQ